MSVKRRPDLKQQAVKVVLNARNDQVDSAAACGAITRIYSRYTLIRLRSSRRSFPWLDLVEAPMATRWGRH